jgi:hypothetical protein
VLGGGVAPVVRGGVGRGGLFAALSGENTHQSVDRHACETHVPGRYDGDLPKLLL